MKIGEFAKVCNMPISVLRYYDSCGLLKPVYIDNFTGYRYYSEDQITVCARINELKAADFSLAEIKHLLSGNAASEDISAVFDRKKDELNEILRHLDELRDIFLGGNFMAETKVELMHENVDIPFENDEKIIGKWRIIGEYNTRTEFELGKKLPEEGIGNQNRELFFLPKGEWYWCYSWTKGKLLIDTGESSFVNDYTVEKHSDGLYMFVKLKSYDYLQNGRTTLLVLYQCDNCSYTANDIARKDNISIPFKDDENILGKWKSVAFVQNKEDFSPQNIYSDFKPYFKEIEFLSNGECTSVYGNEIISGRDMQEWTKGFVLRKWNHTACAYEIQNISDTEYLFMEWKSGNYRWGGFDTDFYVFARA